MDEGIKWDKKRTAIDGDNEDISAIESHYKIYVQRSFHTYTDEDWGREWDKASRSSKRTPICTYKSYKVYNLLLELCTEIWLKYVLFSLSHSTKSYIVGFEQMLRVHFYWTLQREIREKCFMICFTLRCERWFQWTEIESSLSNNIPKCNFIFNFTRDSVWFGFLLNFIKVKCGIIRNIQLIMDEYDLFCIFILS